jgi:hypothetical protein
MTPAALGRNGTCSSDGEQIRMPPPPSPCARLPASPSLRARLLSRVAPNSFAPPRARSRALPLLLSSVAPPNPLLPPNPSHRSPIGNNPIHLPQSIPSLCGDESNAATFFKFHAWQCRARHRCSHRPHRSICWCRCHRCFRRTY